MESIEILDTLASALADIGGDGWLVGGCLRDALLGLPVSDVDVTVTIEVLSVAERLASQHRLAVSRLGHGTIRMTPRQQPATHLDLTPLQGEDIAADLARRDFTVNAMALPLAARAQWLARLNGRDERMAGLIDPFHGRQHLRMLRLVATSLETFRHDPGRILRAARFLAHFGLLPDAGTLHLARAAAPLLAMLARDRIREELMLLLALPAATSGIEFLSEVGALAILYPGLYGDAATDALATLGQLDLFMDLTNDATQYPALRRWSARDLRRIALRQAMLAHARDVRDNADTAPRLWQRARAVLEVENDGERLYAARRLFALAGKDEAAGADALLVAAARMVASVQPRGTVLAARADVLIDIYMSNREDLIPPSLLSGRDLMLSLALSPGPEIGRLLRAVRQAQLAGEITDRAGALALARRLAFP